MGSSSSKLNWTPADINGALAHGLNDYVAVSATVDVAGKISKRMVEITDQFSIISLPPDVIAALLESGLQPVTLAGIAAITFANSAALPLCWGRIVGTDENVQVKDKYGIVIIKFRGVRVVNTATAAKFPG